MNATRRAFLTGGAAAFGAAYGMPAILRRGAALAAEMAEKRPGAVLLPEIDATATGAFRLVAVGGHTEFNPGAPSPTLGFNQSYLGPVIRVRSGATVAAKVENRTPAPISVHWHGLHVPGDVDGGPHNAIASGEVWQPTLDIDQEPATLWYHSHLHRETASRVYAGLAGALVVDDGKDRDRGLPSSTGVDDLILILQDKRFDARGLMIYEPGAADLMHGFLGHAILVNGVPHPVAAVPAGIVRLRLVNAANARNFDLFFEDGRSFTVVASEQGYLGEAFEADRFRLTPGERVEILVDFGGHGAARLMSRPHAETRGTMPMMAGMGHDMLPMVEPFAEPFPLVDFAADPDLPVHVRSLPGAFGAREAAIPETAATRRFVLDDMGMMGGGMMGGGDMAFGINGAPFDMRRLDFEVAAGSTERWVVAGRMMGHPFHVHGVRFRVESENGDEPRPENRGWKDTVFVEGEVSLVARFDRPAPAHAPFMYHCHILEHEDAGMMGQFSVV